MQGNHELEAGQFQEIPNVVCVDSEKWKFWGIYQADYLERNMGPGQVRFTLSSGPHFKQTQGYNLP